MSFGTPPTIPSSLQVYDSYTVDPTWQRKFSIIWGSVAAFAVVVSLPRLIRSVNGKAGRGLWTGLVGGVKEDWGDPGYTALTTNGVTSARTTTTTTTSKAKRGKKGNSNTKGGFGRKLVNRIASIAFWSPPGIEMNVGQMSIVAAYVIAVLVCIIRDAPLMSNPNRAGFLALAQLPPVFLLSTKNSPLSLLLSPGTGYEKLAFLHKWSGRSLFLACVIHGALWINNHLTWGIPIIGRQKETSGVAALGLICVMVLSSVRVVRRWWYELFFAIHVMAFVAFFVTICYHTIYAPPWIFPPLAFFGLDMFLRLTRYRIKDARLIPVDNQMTIVRIPDCSSNWLAGQHVRFRVFFSGRVFESHPYTIMSASSGVTCLRGGGGGGDEGEGEEGEEVGMVLGVRAVGDWSKALNEHARLLFQNSELEILNRERGEHEHEHDRQPPIPTPTSKRSLWDPRYEPVQVMIDGPYGGCSLDLGEYETVLLFAGGSGVTFAIGMLDDLIGRCSGGGGGDGEKTTMKKRGGGEKTRRVKLVWCIRSFGCIEWFAPMLQSLARTAASLSGPPLDFRISIYVTCLCNPEAVPPIEKCTVSIRRPSIFHTLNSVVGRSARSQKGGGRSQGREKKKVTSSTSASPNVGGVGDGEKQLEGVDTVIIAEDDDEADDIVADIVEEEEAWDVDDGIIGSGSGDVAVCASGPESMTREAANAVARVVMRTGRTVGLHTELFAI